MSLSDKIAKVLLWPGEKICDLTGVEGDDHRLILRLFMNLFIYGIVASVVMILFIK